MNSHTGLANVEDNDIPTPFSTGALFLATIALGAGIGLSTPSVAETMSRGIDSTLLVLIFLLFFELRLGAIAKAFGKVRFLAIAWGANFLIIPVIGFTIASLVFSSEPLLFTGLMIYFLAPCTDWFLGFTRMARGDTELGAALIPINIVTQVLLFPIWLWALTQSSGLFDFGAMPDLLIQWFVLPLLAAQALRFAADTALPRVWSDRGFALISRCVPVVLAALIAQIFATHVGALALNPKLFALVALGVCLFFVMTFLVGEGLARLYHLQYPQRALLAMTMAARNAPLMLALTAVALPDQPLILAMIVFGMLVEIPLLTALKQLLLRLRGVTERGI
ncbi:MAG: arsenic resistance protein [Pseudomonadota bacterium]